VNVTVLIILAPLAAWLLPVYVPPNSTAHVTAHLPPGLCNATGTFAVERPIAIACINPSTQPALLSGSVAVEYPRPPPPEAPKAPRDSILAVALGVAAAAGLSHLLGNRRELLAALPALAAARVKRALGLEHPVRREIFKLIERAGAMTPSQIARALGKSLGSVQWHLFVLEREGRVRSVRVGPFTYYFIDPSAAAEVILSSVDPALLSPEDREKLELMASQ
jgi:DNA-binding transcriptional ArsR family regulator